MRMIIEVESCGDCPASDLDEANNPFCNVLLNIILNQGEKDYNHAYLPGYPDIPENCPVMKDRVIVPAIWL